MKANNLVATAVVAAGLIFSAGAQAGGLVGGLGGGVGGALGGGMASGMGNFGGGFQGTGMGGDFGGGVRGTATGGNFGARGIGNGAVNASSNALGGVKQGHGATTITRII